MTVQTMGNHLSTHEMTQLLWDARLTRQDAIRIFQVDARTVRRWLSGDSNPPYAVILLLRVMAYGLHHLPGANPDWKGWRMDNGVLHDSRDQHHTPGSILAWWWTWQMLESNRVEESALNQAMERSENITPLPTLDTEQWNAITNGLRTRLNPASTESNFSISDQPGNKAVNHD